MENSSPTPSIYMRGKQVTAIVSIVLLVIVLALGVASGIGQERMGGMGNMDPSSMPQEQQQNSDSSSTQTAVADESGSSNAIGKSDIAKNGGNMQRGERGSDALQIAETLFAILLLICTLINLLLSALSAPKTSDGKRSTTFTVGISVCALLTVCGIICGILVALGILMNSSAAIALVCLSAVSVLVTQLSEKPSAPVQQVPLP